MSIVFISYSHADSGDADAIVFTLDKLGIETFRDVKDIQWGQRISARVKQGLHSASAVIVIVSPGSLKSQWVAYEVGYGTGTNKRLLPYLTHPELDLPEFMSDLSYVTSLDEIQDFFSTNTDWQKSQDKTYGNSDGQQVSGELARSRLETLQSQMQKIERVLTDMNKLQKINVDGGITPDQIVSRFIDRFLNKATLVKPYFHFLPENLCGEITRLNNTLSSFIIAAKTGQPIDEDRANTELQAMKAAETQLEDELTNLLRNWQSQITSLTS